MSAGTRLPGTPIPMHLWPGAGGVRIAGDSWGDPNGPLVILQHGGGQFLLKKSGCAFQNAAVLIQKHRQRPVKRWLLLVLGKRLQRKPGCLGVQPQQGQVLLIG